MKLCALHSWACLKSGEPETSSCEASYSHTVLRKAFQEVLQSPQFIMHYKAFKSYTVSCRQMKKLAYQPLQLSPSKEKCCLLIGLKQFIDIIGLSIKGKIPLVYSWMPKLCPGTSWRMWKCGAGMCSNMSPRIPEPSRATTSIRWQWRSYLTPSGWMYRQLTS